MVEKKAIATETPDLIVLGRFGHGQNWNPLFSVRDSHKAAQEHKDHMHDTDFTKKLAGMFRTKALILSAAEAKQLCIDYIRDHRAGAAGMDYRIKDRETGQILE